MKKIIVILLVMLITFGCSKDLDKYESKRVFDKEMECIMTGNYEKYENDKEMKRVLEDMEEEKQYIPAIIEFTKNNKYEVIGVAENGNKSILKVRTTYTSYDSVPAEEYFDKIYLAAQEAGIDTGGEADRTTEQKIYVFTKLKKEYKNKSKLTQKIINVYMDKKDGLWDIEDDGNSIFFSTILPVPIEIASGIH